jgi:hypothetical protein
LCIQRFERKEPRLRVQQLSNALRTGGVRAVPGDEKMARRGIAVRQRDERVDALLLDAEFRGRRFGLHGFR